MPRLTLAIETSNPAAAPGSVALAEHTSPEPLALEPLHESARNHDDLASAIDRLFRSTGASPRDLAAVALSVGPGGYTSLRIAVATAKVLADSTGAQTIAIPTALAAAWPLTLPYTPALVLLASKNNTAHGTLLPTPERYRWPAVHTALGLMSAPDLERSGARTLISDRFLPAPIRDEAHRLNIPILEPMFSAASVLALAPLLPPIDPLALAPFYPREPEAVTLWRAKRPR